MCCVPPARTTAVAVVPLQVHPLVAWHPQHKAAYVVVGCRGTGVVLRLSESLTQSLACVCVVARSMTLWRSAGANWQPKRRG